MPAAPRHLSTSRRIGAFTLCAALPLLSIPLASAPSSAAPLTPFALMSLAVHDAVKAGWVHEVAKGSAPGRTFSMDNEIGTTEGHQVVVSNGAHAEVIILGQVAYIHGDVQAVKQYFGLSTTDPAKYANKWLSLTSTSSDFANVSDAVTLQSDFQTITIPGTLKEGSTLVLNGQKVVPIEGTIPATTSNIAIKATLYVSKSSPVLPAEFRLTSSSESVTVTWSKWGHAVLLVAPKSTHPITNP